jgi:superfamily I DNA/RNA helicase
MALLSRHIEPDRWQPIGIAELEANALEVVRSFNNRSVIAGPGSGKTELLAQRACYVLQCGISPAPQRILAISYKRDAASTLDKRVRARVHPELAHRFDSLTFDAFSKSLVDRFGQALPERWRPTPDYEIADATDPIVRDFLQRLRPPATVGTVADIMGIAVKTFEKRHVVAVPLTIDPIANPSPEQWAAEQFWENWLRGGDRSYLTFAMIGRLAELLVRTNPMVRQALQLTYSHLFMDEFQDTTQVQYDLAKSIFRGSKTVVTAVGDYKQQIMRWAMAMDDAFTPFETDFAATRTPLHNNYRSSPDLVRIQGILAKALDAKSVSAVSKSPGTIVGNSCEVWDFPDADAESKGLAKFVSDEMAKYHLKPRDFAVLVRMRAADYMVNLAPAFRARGLILRNEAAKVGQVALQELFSEVVSETLVTLLRLVTSDRAGRYWTDCLDTVCAMRGLTFDDEDRRAKIAKSLDELSAAFAAEFPTPVTDTAAARAVVKRIIDFVGRKYLLAASPAYRQGDWFEKVIDAATLHLEASCRGAKNWSSALDVYEGIHAIPLMTVHKSKSLEYHTVVFVGLEDSAWFNFHKQSHEETAGFFVAFSRTKQRVIFTYCSARGARTQIAPLYELLEKAGVQTIAKK